MSPLPALDPAVELALRLTLAWVVAAAAVHKLRDPAAFREVVEQYRLLPTRGARVFATLLPWLELAIAAALLLGGGAAAGVALALLLLVYCAAMAVNLWRGQAQIDCGCSGIAARRPIGPALLARNGVLILAALLLCLPVLPRDRVWLDVFTIATAFAGFALLDAGVEVGLANAHRLKPQASYTESAA